MIQKITKITVKINHTLPVNKPSGQIIFRSRIHKFHAMDGMHSKFGIYA